MTISAADGTSLQPRDGIRTGKPLIDERTNSTRTGALNRVDPIQGLRAIAALLVVIDHSFVTLIDRAGHSPTYQLVAWLMGGLGVKIFFLISGFIMTVTNRREFESQDAPVRFLWKRLLRIVPLYWLTTGIYALKLSIQGAPPPLTQLLWSLAFVPHRNELGEIQPVYGLGWTLNYEMFFYVLFAFALLQPFRRGVIGLVLALMALVAADSLGITHHLGGAAGTVFDAWGNPIVLYFAGGMLIGCIRLWLEPRGWLLPFRLYTALAASVLVISIYVAWLVIAKSAGALFPNEAAFCVIPLALCALSADRPQAERFRPHVRALGDASYSMYLTHIFLIGPAGRVWTRLCGDSAPLLFVLAMMVGTSLFAIVVYRLVEKPLLNVFKRRSLPAHRPA